MPRRKISLTLALGVMVIMFPDAAMAQAAQTAAGAQEFLGKVMAQGSMQMHVDYGRGWDRVEAAEAERCMWQDEHAGFLAGMQRVRRCTGKSSPSWLSDDDSWMWVDIGAWAPTAASAEGTCKTRVQVSQKGSVRREFKARYDGKAAEFTAWSGIRSGPFVIDWTKVAGVTQSGQKVSLAGVSPAMYFELPSEDLAARVTYAMEFLRLECDAMAGTGF